MNACSFLSHRVSRDRPAFVRTAAHHPLRANATEARRRIATLLAVLALLMMSGLTTWHDAKPHVHDADHALVLDHDDGDHHQPAPEDTIHLSAHAVLGGIDIPPPIAFTVAIPAIRTIWSMVPMTLGRSLDPTSLLRPPRS